MRYGNGHGGKRKGAGRKPNLTLHQEIVIGQTCERLLESAALRAFNRRKRDLFENQTELSWATEKCAGLMRILFDIQIDTWTSMVKKCGIKS